MVGWTRDRGPRRPPAHLDETATARHPRAAAPHTRPSGELIQNTRPDQVGGLVDCHAAHIGSR